MSDMKGFINLSPWDRAAGGLLVSNVGGLSERKLKCSLEGVALVRR